MATYQTVNGERILANLELVNDVYFQFSALIVTFNQKR